MKKKTIVKTPAKKSPKPIIDNLDILKLKLENESLSYDLKTKQEEIKECIDTLEVLDRKFDSLESLHREIVNELKGLLSIKDSYINTLEAKLKELQGRNLLQRVLNKN